MCILADCLDILLCGLGEILPFAALGCVRHPSLEGLEHRLCHLLTLCIRKIDSLLTVKIVGHADLDLLEGIKDVQLCDCDGCESVDV